MIYIPERKVLYHIESIQVCVTGTRFKLRSNIIKL